MREKEKRKITKGEVTKITEGEKQNINNIKYNRNRKENDVEVPAHNQLQFMFLSNFCYVYK